MVVVIDGETEYSKGPFRADNPQPTPGEAEALIESVFPEMPMSAEEKETFAKLHEEQKVRGQTKH